MNHSDVFQFGRNGCGVHPYCYMSQSWTLWQRLSQRYDIGLCLPSFLCLQQGSCMLITEIPILSCTEIVPILFCDMRCRYCSINCGFLWKFLQSILVWYIVLYPPLWSWYSFLKGTILNVCMVCNICFGIWMFYVYNMCLQKKIYSNQLSLLSLGLDRLLC